MMQESDLADFFEGDFLKKISSIVTNRDDDFVKLTLISGLNPKIDFRGREILGIDFGISDLTNFNFGTYIRV